MPPIKPKVEPFCFNSYGVNIEIHSNDADVLKRVGEVAHDGLLGNLRRSKRGSPTVRFDLIVTQTGKIRFMQDGKRITTSPLDWLAMPKSVPPVWRRPLGRRLRI